MQNLICPVCSTKLRLTDSQKSLCCGLGHLFDLGRQGYVNLLLSQDKKSKHPGDTRDMVQARTEFLDSGVYQSISDKLAALVKEYSNISNLAHYCDLACGEGYYTDRLHCHLESNNSTFTTTGIDISNPAIKASSKRNKNIQWIIASTKKIPLETTSQDLVTGLFFHFGQQEIARILKPNGLCILVNTGPHHLIELRKHLYESVKQEDNKPLTDQTKNLLHIKTNQLRQTLSLTNSRSIMQLLAMTPHYWRAKPEKKLALEKVQKLDLSLDIKFDIFIKIP